MPWREEHRSYFSAISTEVMNKPDYPPLLLRLLQTTLENIPVHKQNPRVICISFCRIAAPNSGSISATYKWVFVPA